MIGTLGSLFAGIGGFDLGFERAGFQTAWQCEIDKAAQGVLRRHFPQAKLHSDVREVGAHNLEPVDVLTYGSPCVDLSVAGKREGLAGERSGLFHEAVRIIRELRQRYGKPDFAIWENVPGAFSSKGGADFAAVVQAMVDLGARDVCWRVLDSRYFGVAQRRRRVFLVADFGGERAEQILFEPESLRGDIAKGRKARKEASAGTGAGAAGGGAAFRILRTDEYRADTVDATVSARDYKSATDLVTQPIAFHPTQDPISSQDGVSHTMSNGSKGGTATATVAVGFDLLGTPASEVAKSADVHTPLRARMPGQQENSTTTIAVCATGEVTHALTASMTSGATEDGTGSGVPLAAQAFDRYNSATSPLSPTLPAGESAGGFNHVMAYSPAMQIRRLTPTECERLQGFPDGHTSEGVLPNGTTKPQADGPRYKQLGNAVTVNVAEWIAKRLAATLST